MAFKKDVLCKIKARGKNMEFSQELKIRALMKNDIRCGEIHIRYEARIGEVKFRRIKDSIKNLCCLLLLWKEIYCPQLTNKAN
ncbi:hypothetical protein IIB50_03330 [Patescibacteria group bacterium]|nr:hypothetical protein [Patescibacteria group bacterium]